MRRHYEQRGKVLTYDESSARFDQEVSKVPDNLTIYILNKLNSVRIKIFSIKRGLILLQLFLSLTAVGQLQKYTTANLNMRSDPNTSSNVLEVIPVGTGIELKEDCDCPWVRIYYRGQTGYVSTSYLSIDKPTALNRSKYEVKSNASRVKYYINSKGERVQSPTHYSAPPPGATALCRDGTYSFSRNRRGTCSGHGGVERWL